MPIERIIFYSFSLLALLSAGMMVMLRNPVKALLSLALVFVCHAALWLLLRAEFLSMILVLVYVGAIMVLFLFVVMMIDIESAIFQKGFTRYFPLGIGTYLLMSVLLLYVVSANTFGLKRYPYPDQAPYSLHTLGVTLYTDYLYPLVVAGVLLLLAMIAAISLSFRKRENNKAIDPSLQIKASKANRLRLRDGL
ncbi:MAG: NADH-quinone oxidoreductase subunit J [Gammaproteobacteria bacterium]|nr:NADH-quinone oxidoreductase subunit J [Gammaproteobacteria bacterium]MBP9728701.1 NADH-quinone oxidoreductase subunit J [Gammaproteobacteria bacterium]